ncbi:MAG: zf-TFIIB domain-containing protein [Vulcanimicrobiota bacterium]
MRKCPACQDTIMLDYGDDESALVIDSCPECFGLWFDGEELSRFFQSPRLSQHILEEDAIPDVPSPSRPAETRTCPQCQTPLRPSLLGDVNLDYCETCQGIWLDHGELNRVVELYNSGQRGNLVVVNQLAEGLRAEKRRQSFLRAALWLFSGD